MKPRLHPDHRVTCATFILATLALSGCATAPPAAVKPTSAPTWAVPETGRMAPIPNPEPKELREPREAPRNHTPPVEHAARPPAPAPAHAVAPPPPAPPQASNAVRAARLRAAGLEQMNRGAIDRAVALLQQALALDPGSALIQRDLARAIRISRAVHIKR